MRFSIWPSLTQPWADVVDVVSHAEATGWDGVYLADHFMGDAGAPWPVEIPTLEATAALAALAAATERVRLSPLVLGITYRHPAVLAKWAATVDHVSGGRLLLGVGAGWQENEHEQYGIPLGSPGERIERFEEALRILRGLLTEERTTVEGTHYEVRDAHGRAQAGAVEAADPRRRQGRPHAGRRRPPRRRVEHVVDPPTFAERSAVLDARCEAHRHVTPPRSPGRRRPCSRSPTTRNGRGPSARGSRPGPPSPARPRRSPRRSRRGATPASTRSSSPTSPSARAPGASTPWTPSSRSSPRRSAEREPFFGGSAGPVRVEPPKNGLDGVEGVAELAFDLEATELAVVEVAVQGGPAPGAPSRLGDGIVFDLVLLDQRGDGGDELLVGEPQLLVQERPERLGDDREVLEPVLELVGACRCVA